MTTSVTGSLSVVRMPVNFSARKLRCTWAVSGSTSFPGKDRTGQIVRHGDDPSVWLVRESSRPVDRYTTLHTLVDGRHEQVVGEDCFWPWGMWHPVTG